MIRSGPVAADVASIHGRFCLHLGKSETFFASKMAMRLDEIEWEYQGNSVRVGMTWHGQGASVLCCQPSVQFRTRSEMWPLQRSCGCTLVIA